MAQRFRAVRRWKNGPDVGLQGSEGRRQAHKFPRSVHYWADFATFSRFYRHARWVPTTSIWLFEL
jgi:hypothetical protein